MSADVTAENCVPPVMIQAYAGLECGKLHHWRGTSPQEGQRVHCDRDH